MAGPLIGNPQDILTTPYGYAGQMAPETAVAEQALNRRRLLANMLMQRGMQPRQGQMAGRFYVAPSVLQNVGDLGAVLGGALGSRAIDSKQDDLMGKDRQMVTDAIMAYKQRLQGGAPQAAPGETAAPAMPPPAPQQGLPARPDGPYQGEVGAVPMPDAGVQSDKPPMPAQPPASIAGQEQMQGLAMDQAQPADMSSMVQSPGTQAQPSPSPAPAPTPSPTPAPRKETMDDLVDLLTHQHPQVRRYGEMRAAMLQKQNELESQREFLSGEKALDRDVRREGILENSRMREAQMQNTMALTQMQIDARMQAGKDANDLKESLAKQANDLQKLQIQTAAELKKAEIGSRAETAKQHDETLKAISQSKLDKRGTLPTPALKMQQEALDAIGTSAAIKSDIGSIRSQIDSGKLKLGLLSNLAGEAKNRIGMSDENSRNLASFKATLEKMRNDSLRLNKGVQTEGDSVRAWNELIANINDPEVVKQRLSEIEAINERGVNLQRLNVDTIRQNFGAGPLETDEFTKQPAVVGGNKGGGSVINALPQGAKQIGTSGGKPVYQTPDGKKFIGE